MFGNCKADRGEVIKACSPLLSKNRVIKCLRSYKHDAMDVFVFCLKYLCLNDSDKCDLMKEALDGCPSIPGLPKNGKCPKVGMPGKP